LFDFFIQTYQIVQQSSLDNQDVKVLSVPKSVKILNMPSNRKLSAAEQQQPHTTFQELKLSGNLQITAWHFVIIDFQMSKI